MMAITLEQIAKLAGVSRTTASRVLNGLPGVSPQTHQRVMKIMHEYGFEPDPAARSLGSLRLRK